MAPNYEYLKHPFQLIASLWAPPPPVHNFAAGVAPVADAVAAPHGVCGWVPSETGSPEWVCQSMGQIMPGIVFLVSLAVIAGTAFFLLRYVSRCLIMASELEGLQKALQDFSAVPPDEWAEPKECEKVVARLLGSGRRVPPLAALGQRIKGSLLPVDGDQLVLRKPVASLAEEGRAMDAWTGRALAEVLPNWLTAIGLTTTFIAILIGLEQVKVLENLEVKGIGGLVNGLAGKFFSSIIALGCAVVISVANHYLAFLAGNRWNRVLERLDELLPHLSVERMFLEMSRRREPES